MVFRLFSLFLQENIDFFVCAHAPKSPQSRGWDCYLSLYEQAIGRAAVLRPLILVTYQRNARLVVRANQSFHANQMRVTLVEE